jgi:hypothetical protein
MRSRYEDLLETLLPLYFKGTFLREVRPPWLLNPQTGRRLELDFYNPRMKIAFEVQGKQHYHPGYNKQLEYRRRLDQVKVETCKERGVRLIAVPSVYLRNRSRLAPLSRSSYFGWFLRTYHRDKFIVVYGFFY